MRQVRLDPTTVQNVVTYSTIIDAPNPALLLKPGMTANVTIEVARRDDVLRVSNAALRFKPDAEVLSQYGEGRGLARGEGATVWVSNGTAISPVAVRVGASDGSRTELSIRRSPRARSSSHALPPRPRRRPGRPRPPRRATR